MTLEATRSRWRVRGRLAWSRLVAATSTEEPGTSLAAFRMGVAASLLVLVVPWLVTPSGSLAARFAFVARADVLGMGGYRPAPPASLDEVRTLLWVSAASGLLLFVGLFGRLPAIAAAVCTRLVFRTNPDVSGAGDHLLGNALFLLALSDCTATWSLDCRLRTGRFTDLTPVPAWPRRLAALQLAILYSASGLQKLVSTAWTPVGGCSALFEILQSPHWARSPGWVEAHGSSLVWPLALGTAVTTVWECTFALVLVRPRLRPLYATVGVVLHVGIFALLQVGVFSPLSLAFYPVLFGPRAPARAGDPREGLVGQGLA